MKIEGAGIREALQTPGATYGACGPSLETLLTDTGRGSPFTLKLPSPNLLERLNGEIKRRTDVVDVFSKEAAISRLLGVILLEENDEGSPERPVQDTIKRRPIEQ